MTPPIGKVISPTGQIAAPISANGADAGPSWPVMQPTEPVELPAYLLADARRVHAQVQAQPAAAVRRPLAASAPAAHSTERISA